MAKMVKNGKAFVTITNKDIYNEIQKFKVENNETHQKILQQLAVTNGKVKFHSKLIWFIVGALGTIISWIFYIIKT